MNAQQKVVRKINDGFSEALSERFVGAFSVKVETAWSIFEMRSVTTREDGKQFTPEQHAWIGAFESGYLAAIAKAESN